MSRSFYHIIPLNVKIHKYGFLIQSKLTLGRMFAKFGEGIKPPKMLSFRFDFQNSWAKIRSKLFTCRNSSIEFLDEIVN
jgi:hypothetical protein